MATQVWEHARTQDFMESFKGTGLKIIVSIYSCLHEYKKICENKRSRSFFDL